MRLRIIQTGLSNYKAIFPKHTVAHLDARTIRDAKKSSGGKQRPLYVNIRVYLPRTIRQH